MNSIKQFKRIDKPFFKTPKRVQDAIETKNIYENGVFQIKDNMFSKCYFFYDINYFLSSEDEKEQIFESYCRLLNALDVPVKITINNKNRNMETLKKQILFSLHDDGFDHLRKSYNQIIETKIREGKQGIIQEKYITISCEKSKYDEAISYFNVIESNLKKLYLDLGSTLVPLNAKERLRVLHDFYRFGDEEAFKFEFDESKKGDIIDYICPDMLDFKRDYFMVGDRYCRGLFIKKFPSALSDKFIVELSEMPIHMMLSIDISPIPKDAVVKMLNSKHTDIEEDIIKQQRQRNKNMDFSTEISYTKRKEKEEIEEIMDDVRDNDQRMFYSSVTIVIIADSKEELDIKQEALMTIAKSNDCQIGKHHFRQREALNTVLPIGVKQVQTGRVLLTQSLAVLMPFNVQELYDPGGIFYGINQQSKNAIAGNRKRLNNGNGFTFGGSGSGKSQFNKGEMIQIFLDTDDDIIVVDPQLEYFDIADELNGQIVNISTYTNNFIDPFDVLPETLNDTKFIGDKTEFLLGVASQVMNEELNSRQKSIIDQVAIDLYQPLIEKKQSAMPTMVDFHNMLSERKEQDALDLALSLERFANGSLNIFAHQTNVDVKNRFVVFGIRDMGKDLSAIAMLVMLENIGTRIQKNHAMNRRTWLYIDEIYMLFNTEYSAKYLYELWKRVRKFGGLCTGITQNVEDMLQSYTARTMLANSEFVTLLKQAPTDIAKLSEVMNISSAQLKYVTNSQPGQGLIKFGNAMIPFDSRMNNNNDIYRLINTDPQSKSER